MESFDFIFEERKLNTKVFNSKFLNDHDNKKEDRFTLDDYNNYQTLFIQSSTGTGKTHTIMEHIKEDLQQGKTILSIFGKQSLGKTILGYFNSNYKNHKINHYEIHRRTFTQNVQKYSSFVCVNSLYKIIEKYETITQSEIKKIVENKIIYIDEISIFISETINNTKINNLHDIYKILKYILLYAYKVIVSQSEISEPVFYLLKERTESQIKIKNDSLYVVNKYKKKSIPAYKIKSKEVFFAKMIENYRKGENFLVGSDSCNKITELYEKFISVNDEYIKAREKEDDDNEKIRRKEHKINEKERKENNKNKRKELKTREEKNEFDREEKEEDEFEAIKEEQAIKRYKQQRQKVYLFTRDTQKIEEGFNFEGKTVFYSPSIICGVDCTIKKTQQDQFFYFQGNSISAELIYQQACRTRNMRNLYMFINEKYNDGELQYKNFAQCIEHVKASKNNLISAFKIEGDDREIALDFFNLYCYEEFHLDKYRNLKLEYFYRLLKKDGFILKENNESPKTEYLIKNIKINKITRDYNDLENWINQKEQNENFDKIKEILNIKDADVILNNKEMFLNNSALEKHLLVCSLMHNQSSSLIKLKVYKNKNFIEKLIGSQISKITYLKKLEEKYKINVFTKSGNVTYDDCEITLTDDELYEMKTILKSRKTKEITKKCELVSMIMEYYRNFGFEQNIISRKSHGKYKYEFNVDFINYSLELLHYRLKDSSRLESECALKFKKIEQNEKMKIKAIRQKEMIQHNENEKIEAIKRHAIKHIEAIKQRQKRQNCTNDNIEYDYEYNNIF